MSEKVFCRYLRLSERQCTGEAVDPEGDILLCSKHLARAMVMIESQRRTVIEQERP